MSAISRRATANCSAITEPGAAHERAAEVEELAIEEELGDVAAHRRAAEREHAAARRDLMAAHESDAQEA